jgi:hypothetical protein
LPIFLPQFYSLKHYLVFFLSLVFFCNLNAQTPKRTVDAHRIDQPIKIDGILSESAWEQSQVVDQFVQKEPTPFAAPSFDTKAYILYDDDAVYIGAHLYDDEPDKILKELSLRDQVGNADNFRVFFDPYLSGLNGFKFYVTASGVQFEASVSNHIDDTNWNAVWDSEVSFDDNGWHVEIKIPYASLRFPTSEVQSWGLQVGREVRRLREVSFWSPIDPAISGWVQQSGIVNRLENIKSPVRLSLTPYVTGYINSTFDPQETKQKLNVSPAYSAGLDLKYGINDAFTLDMTLVPDFGQVISDKQVLNLSPFEVFFEENRQFFTEGTELFNKNRLFYSRRIGGQPLNFGTVSRSLSQNERIVDNPTATQLYNATKISGRTRRGTGIGAFNAIVGESRATIYAENTKASREVLTNPLTNYNAFVIDQNLPNNSFVSLINTNVLRRGRDYDANVTGVSSNLLTKNQKYGVQSYFAASQRFFTDSLDLGYAMSFVVGKVSGNWTYNFTHNTESNNYNPNDLGFLFSPNERLYGAEVEFNQYKPRNPNLQQYSITTNIVYSRLFNPNVYSDHYTTINSFFIRKSRFAYSFNVRLEPALTYDYFEPRTFDFSKYLTFPVNYSAGGFVSSDYRKVFAYDIKTNFRYFDAAGRNNFSLSVAPRVRLSDQFSFIFNVGYSALFQEPGYINKALAGSIDGLGSNDILFGNRNRQILDNTLTSKFTFNSKMNLSLRVRHYWDKVIYQSFGRLNEAGYVDKLAFDGRGTDSQPIYDRNVNLFNVDLQYNWRFAPGSDIIMVWKNQINAFDDAYDRNYFQNFGGVFDSIQGNNISLRIIYFIDYQSITKRR